MPDGMCPADGGAGNSIFICLPRKLVEFASSIENSKKEEKERRKGKDHLAGSG